MPSEEFSLSRRTLLTAAAWTTPVVALAAAAPAFACSPGQSVSGVFGAPIPTSGEWFTPSEWTTTPPEGWTYQFGTPSGVGGPWTPTRSTFSQTATLTVNPATPLTTLDVAVHIRMPVVENGDGEHPAFDEITLTADSAPAIALIAASAAGSGTLTPVYYENSTDFIEYYEYSHVVRVPVESATVSLRFDYTSAWTAEDRGAGAWDNQFHVVNGQGAPYSVSAALLNTTVTALDCGADPVLAEVRLFEWQAEGMVANPFTLTN